MHLLVLCSCLSFVLLLLCLIVLVCSAFKFLTLCPSPPLPSYSYTHGYAVEQKSSMSSLNFSSVYVLLVFDNLFLRYSSADMGVTLMCIFILVIVHSVFVTLLFCTFFPCGLLFHVPLQSNVSTVPCPLSVLLQWIL